MKTNTFVKPNDENDISDNHLKNFGSIVASLRKQHHDNWQREWDIERLGQNSTINHKGCLSPLVIANIEAGRKKKLDSETLLQLANGLSLTPLECKDFFLMAVGNDIGSRGYYSDKDARDVFDILLGVFAPSYVIDEYCDFVALNSPVLTLFGVSPDELDILRSKPAGLNLLFYIFTNINFRNAIDDNDWEQVALNNVFFFRRLTLKNRHRKYFQVLLDALLEIDDFRKMWFDSFNPLTLRKSKQNIALTDNNFSIYKVQGNRFIGTDTPIMTGKGELHLLTYTPHSLETANVFMQIGQSSAKKIHFAAPWPEKKIYWLPENNNAIQSGGKSELEK